MVLLIELYRCSSKDRVSEVALLRHSPGVWVPQLVLSDTRATTEPWFEMVLQLAKIERRKKQFSTTAKQAVLKRTVEQDGKRSFSENNS